MKKVYMILFIALVGLAGCGSTKNSTTGLTSNPDDHTLTVWTWDPNYNIPMIQKAADIYTEEVDPEFKIEISEIDKVDINKKMQTAWSADATDDLPDIVLKDNIQFTIDMTSFGETYVPLSDYIDFSDFQETVVEQDTYNEKVYAMPLSDGPSVLMYRKDLFEKAGYSAEDMSNLTWDQLAEMNDKVYEKTGIHGMMMDEAAWAFPGTLELILSSMNIWYPTDPSAENLQDNPEMVKAMEQLVSLSTDDSALPVQNDWNQMVTELLAGNVAAFPGPIWMIPTMEQATDQNGKWAIAEFPRVDGADNGMNAANQGASSWGVTTASDNQQLAVDFLSYVYTDVDYYQYIAENFFVVPYYQPALESDFYDTFTIDLFGDQPLFPQFIKSQAALEYVPRSAYNQIYVDAITSKIPDMIAGTCNVEECLGEADEQVKDQY